MMTSIFAAFAFAATAACAPAGPPSELRRVLQIRTPGGSGHGFASSLLEIYTAFHVVKDESEIHYRAAWDEQVKGAASARWTDEKADIAKLTTYRVVPAVLEFAGAEPAMGETLWFAGFRFDNDGTGDVFYEGRYMGRDEKGLMVVDSNGVEGFSGSPLLNAAGKVVGLMLLYGHPTGVYDNFKCDAAALDRMPCDLQFLMQVSRHRSMTFAAPLWKAR